MRRRRSRIVVHDLKQGHVVRSVRIAAGNNVRKSNRHRRVSNLTRRNLRPQHEGEERNLLHLLSNYLRLPGSIVKSCAVAATRGAGMLNNPAYPNPPVDMAGFKAAIDAYTAAAALDGGKSAITERDKRVRMRSSCCVYSDTTSRSPARVIRTRLSLAVSFPRRRASALHRSPYPHPRS